MTTDPFEALRTTDVAAQPSARFVRRLRGQLVAALSADLPFIDLPERKPAMTTTQTTAHTATTSTAAGSQPTPGALVPYISVAGAAQAITWYVDVLGAREVLRYDADDGRVGHAELEFAGSVLHLADEYPELGFVGPKTVGGTAGGLSLRVADVDAIYAKALAEGADGLRAPEDQPYGERAATIVDPFGHRWMLQTPIATPTIDEINEAMDGFTARVAGQPAREVVELGYFTMTAPDTAAATRFFGALFGWEAVEGNLGEGYAHIANTKLPLGFAPGSASDAPELYFRVTDVAAAAERVRDLGGTVLAEQTYPSGQNADCRDDQGRRFQLWQPAPGY